MFPKFPTEEPAQCVGRRLRGDTVRGVRLGATLVVVVVVVVVIVVVVCWRLVQAGLCSNHTYSTHTHTHTQRVTE